VTVESLAIPEVKLIKPVIHHDNRGAFMEVYKRSSFVNAGITDTFVQWNHSYSRGNVLRGLHFQAPPKAHAKLVRCVLGEIVDVAVDVRCGSPSYGQWVKARLSAENGYQLYVPAGFAHGFAVLSDEAQVSYGLSGEFAPDYEVGIAWDDPDLAIDWEVTHPILSLRDRAQQPFSAVKRAFIYGAP
jgi:dTDP-4-dehydrorhamnose 3,5-epimerase